MLGWTQKIIGASLNLSEDAIFRREREILQKLPATAKLVLEELSRRLFTACGLTSYEELADAEVVEPE